MGVSWCAFSSHTCDVMLIVLRMKVCKRVCKCINFVKKEIPNSEWITCISKIIDTICDHSK